jgi:hypothetical protein
VVWIALAHVTVLLSCEAGKQPGQGGSPAEATKAAKDIDKASAGKAAGAPAAAGAATGGSGSAVGAAPGPGGAAISTAPAAAGTAAETTVALSNPVIEAAARVSVRPIEELFPDRHERNETLPDKMQRRIRFRLGTVAKAPIALRDIIHVPHDDGSAEVFALYEYSAYEECVRGYPTRQAGREPCLGNSIDNNRLRLNRGCVVLGVVHAAFAAPGPNDPSDAGGALTVASAPLPGTLCMVGEHKHTFVADIDHDGALELYADFTTTEQWGGERRSPGAEPTYYTNGQREVVIFSGGKTAAPPLMLRFSEGHMSAGNTAPEEDLVMLHDLDGDGHLDVIALEPCSPEAGPCDPEHRERTVYLFDARLDRWIKGARPKAAAAAAAGRDSPQPAAAAKRDPAP